MNIAEPPYANLARCIVLKVKDTAEPDTGILGASFVACNLLSVSLTPLMGTLGYHAVISRALAVARLQTEGLSEVEIESDGGLKNTAPPEIATNPSEEEKAGTVLLGALITLLVAFIGENLTFRMISDVWPTLGHPDLNFSKETKHEPTN